MSFWIAGILVQFSIIVRFTQFLLSPKVEREAAYLGINTGKDNVALLAAQNTEEGAVGGGTSTTPSSGNPPHHPSLSGPEGGGENGATVQPPLGLVIY